MVNFKSNDRDRKDSRGSRGGFRAKSGGSRFGGGRSRGRSEFGRGSKRFERKPLEMYDVICDKCGKECQVPFKPSGDKPVLCSDCFEKSGGSNRSFGLRNRDRPSPSGKSSEQFSKIEAKLDKIIKALKIDSE